MNDASYGGISKINSSINNCLTNDDLDKVFSYTCDFIYNVLSQHCGPLSEYAFIKDVRNPVDDGTFTKDGINIVRNLSFQTPIQTSLKNAIAHIGSSVEREAADGTTSSMMLAIYTLKYLRMNKTIRKMPVSWLISAWKFIETEVKKIYNNRDTSCKIIPSQFWEELGYDKKTVVQKIAYAQTFTSSHGDLAFSRTVSDLFSKIPQNAWSTILVKRSEYETEENYAVEIDNTEWTFNRIGIHPFNQRLTENLEGVLRRTNEKCFICLRSPLLAGDLESQELIKKISASIKANEEVTYICSGDVDANSLNYIDNLYMENPSCRTTIIFAFTEKNGVTSDLEAIPMMIEGYNGELITEVTLDYECNGKKFKILKGLNNFADSIPEDQLCIEHPWIGDNKSEHKLYNEFVSNLKKAIARSAVDYNQSEYNVSWYEGVKILYNKMTLIHRVSFIIGGSLYNNLTAVDIVHDTLPAVRRTLERGFCRGENKSLYIALEKIITDITLENMKESQKKDLSSEEEYLAEVAPFICRTIMTGIEHLHEIIHDIKFKKNRDGSAKGRQFDPFIFEDAVSKGKGTTISDYLLDKNNTSSLIIQPVDTDLEFLKRFGEMMIRFIKTNKMITVGTLVIKE